MKKTLALAIGVALGSMGVLGAQTAAAPAAPQFTHVEYYSAAQLQGIVDKTLADIKAKGLPGGGPDLSDDANSQLKISVRTASGGAEMHRHWSDVIIVTGGEVTLTAGGTIPDLDKPSSDEPRGTRIVGGTVYHLKTGDVVHIPINTPHQMTAVPGKIFSALVVKVKE